MRHHANQGHLRLADAALPILLTLLLAAPLWGADDATELAKKTQNPVADLISIPLQNNFNFGVGPNNVTQYVGNIQPVNTQRSAYYDLEQP